MRDAEHIDILEGCWFDTLDDMFMYDIDSIRRIIHSSNRDMTYSSKNKELSVAINRRERVINISLNDRFNKRTLDLVEGLINSGIRRDSYAIFRSCLYLTLFNIGVELITNGFDKDIALVYLEYLQDNLKCKFEDNNDCRYGGLQLVININIYADYLFEYDNQNKEE